MKLWIGAACALFATVAVAHEGVKNPAVMERMHGMKSIGAETKVLGDMAKGTTAFDAARAKAAASTLAKEARRIEALFEAREDDPKSEALPAVWTDFPDFVLKSQALIDAAENAQDVATLEELRARIADIGATCSGCHKVYRQP